MNARSPSLSLDRRQRAMLKEMGIRVWSPMPTELQPDAADPVPAPVVQRAAEPLAAAAPLVVPRTAPVAPTASAEPAQSPAERPPSADRGVSPGRWQLAPPQALYADAAPGDGGPRWLILAEAPAGALQAADFHPLAGDAGVLLDNMLRAARLAEPGRVLLVPMAHQLADDAASASSTAPALDADALRTTVAALVATHQPHVVLVMGRLAAQALLQSTEPLGKLRGQVHALQGAAAVVTYDPQPLLRTPADKAKAWDDLCLALAHAATAFRR